MTIPPQWRHLFYTELAKLVEAGFGIREAAGVMLETRPSGAERKLLEGVLAGLGEGRSIADAFEGDALSRMERGVIAAGERGGKLGAAFLHLADHYELMAAARRDARKAMIYPLVLLHLGILLAAIPADVMSGGIRAEGVLRSFVLMLLVAWGGIFLVGAGVAWLWKRAAENASLDRLLGALPVVGGARRNLAMARFTKVYHAGLLAGLSMNETATMAGEAADSGAVSEASERIAEVASRGGELGPAFVAEPAFPRAFAKSYATAETSGMLDKDLLRWSKVFQEDAANSVRQLSVVLPKLGYLLVVIFVVWKVVSFYSGYYGSLEQIGI